MNKIIAAKDVICEICNAQPGEQCTFWYGSGRRRFKREMHGTHVKRGRAAEVATRAYNALMNS